MDKTEFQELIQAGLGRAIIYARENDVRTFRDVILDACLHCCSVDVQSEGTRAGYMLELVDLMPDRQFYCDAVLEALPGSGDNWDAVQRFHFATYMALDGDEPARRLLYESFDPGSKMGEDIAIDFVRLDGLKGLLFAAEKIGALLSSKPDEVDEGWLWSQATEICGEQETMAALIQAGKANPDIETYRLTAERNDSKRNSGQGTGWDVKGLGYDALKARLQGLTQTSGIIGIRLGRWGEEADLENLERAAVGLIAAQTAEDQLAHLRVFQHRSFPMDQQVIVELAVSRDELLANAACGALAQITHPSVRELAFQLIQGHRTGRDKAISMLARNWEPGDHAIALGWFEQERDRDVRHWTGMGLRKFWESHPEPATEPRMLCSLYEKGPCSCCREFVVDRLIELKALSEPMRAECAHDANDEIRKLVAAA